MLVLSLPPFPLPLSLSLLLPLQSCCQEMKVLTDRLQLTLVEAKELEQRMAEFKDGLRAQISSILAAPPPLTKPKPVAPTPEQVPNLIDLETSDP